MADNGDRVLVIDGDLRKPDVAQYLGLDGSIGLSDVLIGKMDLADALQAVADSSLTAPPSGSVPPNPNELIQWTSMQTLMEQLLERFDRTVIDSPPLLPVSDAGVLVVVTAGRTSASQLSTVVERLDRVDTTVLGAVLNGVRLPADQSVAPEPASGQAAGSRAATTGESGSTDPLSAEAVRVEQLEAEGGPQPDAHDDGHLDAHDDGHLDAHRGLAVDRASSDPTR